MWLSLRGVFGTWFRAVAWGRSGTQGGDTCVTVCHVFVLLSEGEATGRVRKRKSVGWCFPICVDGDIRRFC